MKDLDSRLAGWDPVRAEDVSGAATSGEAIALLHRILSDPPGSSRTRRSSTPRRVRRIRIALAVAGAVAAGAIFGAVLVPAGSTSNLTVPKGAAGHPGTSPAPSVAGFQPGPSEGVARDAIQLVDYAAASAAKAAVYVPGPQDWEYNKTFTHGHTDEMWQQVGTAHIALRENGGKLTFAVGGGPGAQLNGWPGNWTDMYQYLASLPAQPEALRKVILANNHGDASAAFIAINNLSNFPLPPRFQAELYAVLVSLPGVHFFGDAVDPAGRHGIGLYMTSDGGVVEIIINPRTYVYMGAFSALVDPRTPIEDFLANPPWGKLSDYGATLGAGIVSQPGQVP